MSETSENQPDPERRGYLEQLPRKQRNWQSERVKQMGDMGLIR
jgi:hypothetical protein